MKDRAPRNRTLTLTDTERNRLRPRLLALKKNASIKEIVNRTLCQDLKIAAGFLPEKSVDLLFLDPPYNLNKTFRATKFKKQTTEDYSAQLELWLIPLLPLLKKSASVYICGDWLSSPSIFSVAEKFFTVRNRITWEREKGRGAKSNWKNCSEDIWFCTVSDDYIFNVDSVKMRRKVVAPYRENGKPKDWVEGNEGSYRLTHPSNMWSDITIPYWSMPENTDHPTQKSEKLLAKLILASTVEGGLVLDPFLGSGTTSVVSKKLGRSYVGIEMDPEYCMLAERRLEIAEENPDIQGYASGYFWGRNTGNQQKNNSALAAG